MDMPLPTPYNEVIFISGIGTDVGKTLVAAIFCEALQAYYWKPVQSGSLDYSDTQQVAERITQGTAACLPEAYRLRLPASPHAAAAAENRTIQLQELRPPAPRPLVVEGSGGILVPLNNTHTYGDWLAAMRFPTVLVSRNYLGSINHTLLSIEALRQRDIPLLGIVFNGETYPAGENFILQHSQLPCLLRIPDMPHITPQHIQSLAQQLRKQLMLLAAG